jgi:DnaJ-class molecular chaperone
MPKKVEDPELQCPRCEGTGEIDEHYSPGGSYGQKKIGQFGTCPDCGGSGRKPQDESKEQK